MFIYHNSAILEKYSVIIKNDKTVAKFVYALILIYAKYIHYFDKKYIDRILFYLEKVNEVECANQRIIETL